MCVSCTFSTNIASVIRKVLYVLYALMAASSWKFPYAAVNNLTERSWI